MAFAPLPTAAEEQLAGQAREAVSHRACQPTRTGRGSHGDRALRPYQLGQISGPLAILTPGSEISRKGV